MTPTTYDTLAGLKVGHPAAVLEVSLPGKAGLRLQEMGLVAGSVIEVLSEGDTMLIKIGEQRLSLRRETALSVRVFPT
jgi:Fe2+ transport system protein FeoA